MKRNIVSILLLLFILIPFNVKAIAIKNVDITSNDNVKVGEEVLLKVNINFSEDSNLNTNNLGIWMLNYEIIYDNNALIATDFISDDWESALYEENGKYYILSAVKENVSSPNKCSDGLLQCSNYEVTIKFFVRNTEKSSTSVGINNIEAGLLMVPTEAGNYDTNNISLIEGNGYNVKTIKIAKTENQVVNEPQNIISNTKPNVNKQPEITNPNVPNENAEKSNNNYLSSLTIENYEIDFEKNKHNYRITVPNDVNKLNLNIELEDSKASYTIIGADDLEKNDYKVQVEVTAENGEKSTYTINVKRPKVEEEVANEKESFHLDKKYIIFGCIGLGIILIIIIIVVIINKINDRKLNKALDELDKM